MSANLDETLGFVALAFVGPRSKIWHGTGQSVDDIVARLGRPLTREEWSEAAGSSFTVSATPVHYRDATGALRDYPDRFVNAREDTGAGLGLVSTRYNLVQPVDAQNALWELIEIDPRFTMTTMGSLDGGKRIWAQATFAGEQTIGGSAHKVRLLASTTFNTTSPTRLQSCMECVVCQNTINVAMGEDAPKINVRHSTKFDAAKAMKALASIAAGFAQYKQIGDALAGFIMPKEALSAFIRGVLDIPIDAEQKDVSTRKKNQRQSIIDALSTSCNERAIKFTGGAANIDAFTALQAITRYVDHDRDAGNTENRLFGSGAALKDKALGLLMPMIKDRVAA
jgi:phage/plasmid-like protein (TIGR03299 family)